MSNHENGFMPIVPDLEWLEQQQRESPTNFRLAHDIGLAHYWMAKLAGEPGAVAHWHQVIANWVMVLESDTSWQEWAQERFRVYGQGAYDRQIISVKERLYEHLGSELAQFESLSPIGARSHLQATFSLEAKAIHFLEDLPGIQLTHLPDAFLRCGPLLVAQLGIQAAAQEFFRTTPCQAKTAKDSLENLLASVLTRPAASPPSAARALHQLRICFSSLGLPFAFLARNEPQLALDMLAQLHCPECHPQFTARSGPNQLIAPCRGGCSRFAQFNLAYAALTDGQDLYARDAAELFGGAHLSLAEQDMTIYDFPSMADHLRQALAAGQELGIQAMLRDEIGNLFLDWADKLDGNHKPNEAISVLEASGEFERTGRWRSKLALCLNQRGVEFANSEQWDRAAQDLRRACALSPYVAQMRENLKNVLKAMQMSARASGDHYRADQLHKELEQLEKGDTLPLEPAPTKPAIVHPPDYVLVHSQLFDSYGQLKEESFSPESGKMILKVACERAFKTNRAVLDLEALVFALASLTEGKTRQLLLDQGITTENLKMKPKIVQSDVVNRRLECGSPSQFDLWIDVLEVFKLAWDKAHRQEKKIGEGELLYGLLKSQQAICWLQSSGVDTARLAARANVV